MLWWGLFCAYYSGGRWIDRLVRGSYQNRCVPCTRIICPFLCIGFHMPVFVSPPQIWWCFVFSLGGVILQGLRFASGVCQIVVTALFTSSSAHRKIVDGSSYTHLPARVPARSESYTIRPPHRHNILLAVRVHGTRIQNMGGWCGLCPCVLLCCS